MESQAKNQAARAAVKDFTSGLACSQAVLAAFAERYGLSRDHALRLAAAFEGGTGMRADTCGALVAVYLVLGLEYGGTDPGDLTAKQTTARKVNEATRLFREGNGDRLTCRDLLGCDISTPEGLAEALREDVFLKRCPRFVRDAVRVAEELLDKGEANGEAKEPA